MYVYAGRQAGRQAVGPPNPTHLLNPPNKHHPRTKHTGEIEESQTHAHAPTTNPTTTATKRPGAATLAFQAGSTGSGRGLTLGALGFGTVTDFGDVESPRCVFFLSVFFGGGGWDGWK